MSEVWKEDSEIVVGPDDDRLVFVLNKEEIKSLIIACFLVEDSIEQDCEMKDHLGQLFQQFCDELCDMSVSDFHEVLGELTRVRKAIGDIKPLP